MKENIEKLNHTNLAADIWRTLSDFPEIGIYKDLENFLKEKLNGKTLVDLGVGQAANLPSSDLLNKLGVKKYCAVEKYLDDIRENDERISSDVMLGEISNLNREEVSAEFFKEDMLELVSKLPDASANFSILAIDQSVIPSEKYWLDLAREIERATEADGIVISKNSSIGSFLNERIFKESEITAKEGVFSLINVFEKIN